MEVTSTRRVGVILHEEAIKKLNLTVSSIYWHFNSKEAIFQEQINQVIGEIEISLTKNTWQEQLLEYGYAISEARWKSLTDVADLYSSTIVSLNSWN